MQLGVDSAFFPPDSWSRGHRKQGHTIGGLRHLLVEGGGGRPYLYTNERRYMKRLLGSSWKRIGLQVGLLAGVGLAFAVGTHEQPAEAGGDEECPQEDDCTFKKPNVMVLLDYSASMNEVFDGALTRWEVVTEGIKQVTQPGSFLSLNTHLALMRYGHDPDPGEGSVIEGDTSGLVDGVSLDLAWDDDNNVFQPCNGQAFADAIDGVVAPMMGATQGIGTYAFGGFEAVIAEIDQTKADHPEDGDNRAYVVVQVTDGAWTSMNGTTPLMPPEANPAPLAQQLFDDDGIPTFVVAVAGDPAAEAAADETAAAGGTTEAIDGDTPEALQQALTQVVQDVIDAVVAPECVGGQPRIMILLDASSSMLNVGDPPAPGGEGETGWDQARAALAGETGIFDVTVGIADFTAEDVSQLGLSVFGHNTPGTGEQEVLINYGPCMKDNFAWALDPNNSCGDGCTDPWGGPPIAWEFQNGAEVEPFFDQDTISHMPQCGPGAEFCSGSGTFTHLGLRMIKENLLPDGGGYGQQCLQDGAQYPCNDDTLYINILVTDGQYSGSSTDAQVQTELEEMFAAGVVTYVIGFGNQVDSPAAIAQLENMADWGSGGAEDYFAADSQADLEMQLAAIFENVEFDPCCTLNDCSQNPEPTTNEPDIIGDDDAGDEAGEEAGDEAGEEAGDEAGEEAGDEAGDEAGEEAGDEAGEEAGDEAGEEAGDEAGDDRGDEAGDDAGTETGDGGGSLIEDDGCNCSAPDSGADKTRGLLGTVLALGLFGFVRRRRRQG